MSEASDFDRIFNVAEADTLVRQLTEGKFYIRQVDGKLLLCEQHAEEGLSLLPYQLTRRGILRAVVEVML